MVWQDFSKWLDADLQSAFEGAQYIQVPVYHRLSKRLELALRLPVIWKPSLLDQIQTKTQLHFQCEVNFHYEWQAKLDLERMDQYVQWLASQSLDLACFLYVRPVLEGDSFVLSIFDEAKYAVCHQRQALLVAALKRLGFMVNLVVKRAEDNKEVETHQVVEPIVASEPVKRKEYRPNGYETMPIGLISLGERVEITGEAFKIDTQITKSNKCIQKIYVSDYQDAILVKRFETKLVTREELDSLKKGQYIRVRGEVVYDQYERANIVNARSLEVIEKPVRHDLAEEKRIELHLHTVFSDMDGVSSIEDYIQQANDWGWSAIGVTDHNVVQAFPFAQNAVKRLNNDFQMLYGCEFDVVDEHFPIVTHPDERLLNEVSYVVFDLETTGLSCQYDRMIEFGGVRVEHGEIVDRLQFFIDPERSLPAEIVSLTGITDAMVKGAVKEEEAVKKILAFFKDAVLVAHNGQFDYGFILAASQRAGLPFTNSMIDTLPWAHVSLNLARYALGALCRHYRVNYDGQGAHRADYDAEVLAACFLKMVNDLPETASLLDLEKLDRMPSLYKRHASHMVVYARDEQGLKDLFELVSLAHTTYLGYNPEKTNPTGRPIMPKSVLAQKREHLLIGSACQNGELFDLAMTGSLEALKEACEFYDYVEIQPLACYRNLLDRGSLPDDFRLKAILKQMVDVANEKSKLVVATGDAHYVDPTLKRVRDVYINAKGIGGTRHPLYVFDANKRHRLSSPDQHLRTTDEMLKEFAWLNDEYKMVIDNPRKLKEMMKPLYPQKSKLYPPNVEGSDEKLKNLCFETAKRLYGDPLPEVVESRLTRELDSIIGHGFYVVYYISHLLVKKSNDDGYIVGSRGSVGSSFAATMSGITEVNPLTAHYVCPNCHHYEFLDSQEAASGFDLPDKSCPKCGHVMRGDGQDIPFETFLGFEGDKVPDIDLNFSGEYQPIAHQYCREVFGQEHSFRAGTIATVQEQYAFGYVRSFEEEMGLEPLSQANRMDLASRCEGVKRSTGQHPAGIVIVPEDMSIYDFTPVQYPANNPQSDWLTTHFDFHQIHDNILKFDILGHVDPTAMKFLEVMTGVDVRTIPMNDPETMSIFNSVEALRVDTTRYSEKTGAAGLPEFGTPFVRGILQKTSPNRFSDLVTISGLSHGTGVWRDNAESLIDRGICTLQNVIGCRDDIMVKLMEYGLKPKLAFTIMESVRKGKGLKEEWIKDMKGHGVPDWYIESCQKIEYMFPKAHAVAYVMMAVRIAWFKVHIPLAYYCMFFSIRCDAYEIETMVAGEQRVRERMTEIMMKDQKERSAQEKALYTTLELVLEFYCRGYHFENINLELSQASRFIVSPHDSKAIIPSFTTLPGLGESVAQTIVKAREQSAFVSQQDLLKRTKLSTSLLDKMKSLNILSHLDEENQMRLF